METKIIEKPISRFVLKALAIEGFGDMVKAIVDVEKGSEVSRAANAQNNDQTKFENARFRALELFDLTLDDPRWQGRLKEIARAREVFCDAARNESREYHTSLKDLEKYFFDFALLTRRQTQLYGNG